MSEMIISKKIVLSKWEKPKPSKYLMLEGKRIFIRKKERSEIEGKLFATWGLYARVVNSS